MDFSKMAGLWQAVMLKPEPTLAAQAKTKAKLMDGLIGYAIAAVISGVISVISLTLFSSAALKSSPLLGVMTNPLLVLAFGIVMGIVSSFIMAGLLHVLAGVLGGKGSFTQLYYLLSIIAVPIAVVNIVSIIPVLGALISLVVSLYSLYLWVLAISKLYGMSLMRSVGVVVLAIVVVFAIAMVISIVAAGYFISAAAPGLIGY